MKTFTALATGVLLGFSGLAAIYLLRLTSTDNSPAEIAQAFFLDSYTHDYRAVWSKVSAEDQAATDEDTYLAQNEPLDSGSAALYQRLAGWGKFQLIALVSDRPDQVIVTAHAHFPDRAQPEFIDLVEQTKADSSALGASLDALDRLYERGDLRFVEDDLGYNLIRQDRGWRVVQNWGEVVTVRLAGAVSPGLPWEFYPVERQVLAVPGELVMVSYLARNISDQTITAQAVHQVGPSEVASYFQTIQCFCFTEQTLQPGEQRQMTLQFRIDSSLPAGVAYFQDRYTFYSLDEFPTDR